MRGLRIGTWNVQYAAGAEKNVGRRERLIAENADIWVLTETHDDLALPDHVAVSTVQRLTGRTGGRWTTIWSRFPVIERVVVVDAVRTVAALLESSAGPLLVFGTVLPWHSDPGPVAGSPAKAWSEHHRVIPEQTDEWRALRAQFPGVPLVVAGDLNMNLGGKHYYGTKTGRALLREGMAGAELACATETERVPLGALAHGPIDHVLVPVVWAERTRVVSAWEGTVGGVKYSDHSGVVVEVG
ncbi:MAG: endonuclease/exonuclease/phosphatase family protein [Myxococcota bacterium]